MENRAIGHRRSGAGSILQRLTRRLRGAAIALILPLAVAGCATPGRLDAVPPAAQATVDLHGASHIRFLVARDTSDFKDEFRQSIAREQAWRAANGRQGALPPVDFLAISGGGDSGAFGAGLLNGWSAAGTRPEFRAVTGVSTGALIAPFAFLGPRYDGVLKAVYTQSSPDDIFRRRNLLRAFFGDALSDTTPLHHLVARYVDRPLLDAIAAEYAKGRLLLVGTTNLDTLEPVIWNMTAIAASKDPDALELFRRILLASAAIPGMFPPVMIDVEVNGVHYQEMHADGGTVSQVFTYPPSFRLAKKAANVGAERVRVLYIIRNARLDADWAKIQRRTLPIAGRAISSLLQNQGIGDLYRIYLTAKRDGLDYNLAYIPQSFNAPRTKDFDPAFMRPLYQLGYDMAVAGYPWEKYPPGYAATILGPGP
jgi:predicted acylesterase/phospholipase RssA